MIYEWPTAIEDVTNTFQNHLLPNVSVNTQIWIMMEVLCGIPEEVRILHTFSVAHYNYFVFPLSQTD